MCRKRRGRDNIILLTNGTRCALRGQYNIIVYIATAGWGSNLFPGIKGMMLSTDVRWFSINMVSALQKSRGDNN